jgi:ribonuclease HII
MTVVVDVHTIDERVRVKELNLLEREVATVMIDKAPQVDVIIADGKNLFRPLCERYEHLTAMNKAESHHASVAAASVLAKTRRDEIFARILCRYRDEFGTITGGGYVNAGTRKFLRAYAERYHQLPPEARCSWPHEYVDDLIGDEIESSAGDPDPQLGLF